MTNKKIVRGAALAGLLAVAIAGCSSDNNNADSGEVVFTGYGGSGQESFNKAFLAPFTEETGIEVLEDSPTSRARVIEMVESGNVIWDVVQSGYSLGVEDNAHGVLAEIDCSIVPCSDFDGGPFQTYKYGVPSHTFSVVLAYNTNAFPSNPPSSYADFFDTEKYPGKRAIYTGAPTGALNGILDQALINDGVAHDAVYPLDVDRAINKLATIKDDIIFYTDFGQCTDLVASGEAVMGNCYNGRVLNAKNAGQPIDMGWGQQVIYTEYVAILKDSPNPENAQKLVAHIVAAANNAKYANYIAYGPTNPNSKADASSEFLSAIPSENVLDGADAPLVVDNDWWAKNMDAVAAKWDAFVASN